MSIQSIEEFLYRRSCIQINRDGLRLPAVKNPEIEINT